MAEVISGSSTASGLRPFTIGELADRCFQLYRRHFIALFYFSAIVQSVPFALSLILAFLNRDIPITDLPRHPELIVWFLGWFAASFLLLTLGEGALTDFTGRLYLGQSVSIRSSLAAMVRRSVALLWSTLLKYLFIGLALLPFFIPVALITAWHHALTWWTGSALAIVALLLFMPWLVLAVRYLVLPQSVMLEKKNGLAALRRSSEIIRYNPGPGIMQWGETRISLLLLVIAVANLLVAFVSRVPILVTWAEELLRGNANPNTAALSPLLMIVTPLFNFLGTALIAPLYIIAGTVFYDDVRVRKEAYDLELLAEELQSAASTSTEAAKSSPS